MSALAVLTQSAHRLHKRFKTKVRPIRDFRLARGEKAGGIRDQPPSQGASSPPRTASGDAPPSDHARSFVLPVELLEEILLKSFLLVHSAEWIDTARTPALIYTRLASVCAAWRMTASSRRWFEQAVLSHIAKLGVDNVRLRNAKVIRPGGHVTAVTRLHSRIYVHVGTAPSLQAYDALTLARLKDVLVTSSTKKICVEDLAASPTNSCLYLYDRHAGCVWRISVGEAGHVAVRWLRARWEEPHYYVGTLFVTSRGVGGRVLLLGDRPARVDVYRTDASLERSVVLPSNVCEPRHVVETDGGSFVVSFGWWRNEGESRPHGVCEVTGKGELLRVYHGGKGQDSRLDRPVHLALDAAGRVFVADFMRQRVLVCDPALRRCRTVVGGGGEGEEGKGEGWYPQRLCYVGGCLIVAHTNGLSVYDVTAGERLRRKVSRNVGLCY